MYSAKAQRLDQLSLFICGVLLTFRWILAKGFFVSLIVSTNLANKGECDFIGKIMLLIFNRWMTTNQESEMKVDG